MDNGKPSTESDQKENDEAERRFNDTLGRLVNTPHKPHAPLKPKKPAKAR